MSDEKLGVIKMPLSGRVAPSDLEWLSDDDLADFHKQVFDLERACHLEIRRRVENRSAKSD